MKAMAASGGSLIIETLRSGSARLRAGASGHRSLRMLLTAAVILPLLLTGVAAWLSWGQAWRQIATEVQRTADATAEYTLRLLEGHRSAVDRVNDLLRGLSDEEIREREAEFHLALRKLVAETPQIQGAYVGDRHGHLLVSASVFPVPDDVNNADREFHQLLAVPDAPGVVLTRVYQGRVKDSAFFAVARRRRDTGNHDLPAGTFDGQANVSVSPAEVSRGFRRLSGHSGGIVTLMREDGAVLARSLDTEAHVPGQLAPDAWMKVAEAWRRKPDVVAARSPLDGVLRLGAFRQVEGWPVYIFAGQPYSDVVTLWAQAAMTQLAVGLPAALALFGLALLVRRGQRSALADSEARLRQALDAGRAFTFDWEAASGIVTRSPNAGKILGISGEAVTRDAARNFMAGVVPEDADRLRDIVARITPGDPRIDVRFRYRRPDGRAIWLQDQGLARFAVDGSIAGITSITRDVTAEAEAEAALRASEARLRLATEGAGVGTWELDLLTDQGIWSPEAAALFSTARSCFSSGNWADVIHPDDRTLAREAWRRAVAEGTPYEVELRAAAPAQDGYERWLLARGQIERDASGRPIRVAGFVLDVTERHRQEERLVLLAREVDHRARNALAVVQATLRLTPKDDVQEYARAVEGRVMALARTHTMLAEGRWAGADLHALVRGELMPFFSARNDGGAGGLPRVELDGPRLRLSPGAAQGLSMALHELATNAVKHGALSVPGGSVRVTWSVDPEQRRLSMQWREAGGPGIAAPPPRRGFGSRMLEATIARQLGGWIESRWAPTGLICEIELPLSRSLSRAGGMEAAPAPVQEMPVQDNPAPACMPDAVLG